MANNVDSQGLSYSTDINDKVAEKTVSTDSPELEETPIVDRKAEKALVRKVDFHILPVLTLLYLLSFLDRSNGLSPY